MNLTCVFINDIRSLNMTSDGFDASFVGAEFLEERVICLQIQHARAFPISCWTRRWLRTVDVHEIVLHIEIYVVLWIKEVGMLIARMLIVVWMFVGWIVVGKDRKGMVVVIIIIIIVVILWRRKCFGVVTINKNIWFLCWPMLCDYFHVGFMIRPRVRVRLLICRCEIIVNSILASIVAIVDVWQHILFVVWLRNDVTKVDITVGTETVDNNIPMWIIIVVVVVVWRRWLITLKLIIIIWVGATAWPNQQLIVIRNFQVKGKRRIPMIS